MRWPAVNVLEGFMATVAFVHSTEHRKQGEKWKMREGFVLKSWIVNFEFGLFHSGICNRRELSEMEPFYLLEIYVVTKLHTFPRLHIFILLNCVIEWLNKTFSSTKLIFTHKNPPHQMIPHLLTWHSIQPITTYTYITYSHSVPPSNQIRIRKNK